MIEIQLSLSKQLAIHPDVAMSAYVKAYCDSCGESTTIMVTMWVGPEEDVIAEAQKEFMTGGASCQNCRKKFSSSIVTDPSTLLSITTV